MKHLKKFNENLGKQINDSDFAREVIGKYYTIADEYGTRFVDFLVDSEEFLNKMMENDGFIAGNYFSDRDHILEVMSELSTMVPDFYIAPFWSTRYEEDIAGKDVYADTIYVPCIEDLTVKNDKIIKPLFKFLEADEIHIVTGKSGQKYIRIWWD